MSLLNEPDDDVRFWTIRALAQNKASAVRALALWRLNAGRVDGNTIALLKRNYEHIDHRLIERALVPRDDPIEMHDLCWGLIDVFAENKTADSARSMLFAYEHTPCSNCRERSLTRLLEFDKVPSEVLEECQFDANPDIRQLVAGA